MDKNEIRDPYFVADAESAVLENLLRRIAFHDDQGAFELGRFEKMTYNQVAEEMSKLLCTFAYGCQM